jgi:acyl carrier protein
MNIRRFLFVTAFLLLMMSTTFAADSDSASEHRLKVSQKFVRILNEQWGIDTSSVKGETLFLSVFGADSVDIVELVMALEETFDIMIGDNDWSRVTTVDSAVKLIIDATDDGRSW